MSVVTHRFVLPMWIALGAFALLSHAAELEAAAADEAEEHVILTYDVGDLLLDVPDYPYPGSDSGGSSFGGSSGSVWVSGMGGGMGDMGGMGGGMGGTGGMGGSVGGGMGGMGGGMSGGMGGGGGTDVPDTPPSTPRSAKITIDDLILVMTSVVAPETWPESGGEGEVQCLGTSLVIRQTAKVHEQIKSLLEQLRESSDKQKTVAIDARWLLLTSDELESLMPPNDGGTAQIDRKVLGEFTRRPSSLRGQTNCFTGQLVYLVSGTRRNVVTSVVPVVGSLERPQEGQYALLPGGARILEAQTIQSSRSVGYQPVISTPNLGVLLQIRPTLIPGDSRAIVDLRSTLTVLGESVPDVAAPSSNREYPLMPKVDRVAIETQEFATTLSVSLGQPTLAGGLTYIGSWGNTLQDRPGAEGEDAVSEVPQLYLIVELK